MTIDCLRPLFLLLLLALPLLWFFPRRVARVGHGLLRTLVFAAVILALAQPVLLTPERSAFQVFVLDQSASLGDAARGRARQLLEAWRQKLTQPARSAVVVIGAGPPLPPDLPNVVQIADDVSASSLSAALAAAEREIPAHSSGVITLVSDGLSTDRRWGPTVQRLIARGIPVAAYDLGRAPTGPYPAGLTADPQLRVGQTARVAVTVIGAGTGLRVRLADGEGRELALSPPVDSADRVTVPLEFEPREAGFIRVQAQVLPAAGTAADPANLTFSRTLAVQPPLRLLYLGDRVKGAAARLGELLGPGFAVQDGSGQPLDAGVDLGGSDLVMLDDRPASLVPEEFQARLAAAVRQQGIGLLFTGGKSAFGTGGYDHTPVADLLPVDLLQRMERRDPSTALAVIIDTSGSMMGTPIELAKQVTRLAVRRLKAHDRVGIVEFYGNKHWTLPLQSAGNKIAIDRAIGRMQATGGTVLSPAIEEAYYGLKNVNTRYKHILIITDAGVEPADYESMARRIAKDNINMSTVLVGSMAQSQLLIDIAAWGRGRHYSASDRYALPEVVLKQATTMNLPAYKSGAFPVLARGGTGWWGGVDRQAVPALDGYVETEARAGAEVLLEVEGSGHPVLASWQYGVGRVTTLMTEPVGEGTAAWAKWRDYGRWLGRIASRTAGDLRPFRFEVLRADHQLSVVARRYADRTGAQPQVARLDAAGREGAPLAFRQLSPDHFVAETVLDPRREARFIARAIDAAGSPRSAPAAFLVSSDTADVAAERQVDPALALDLPALARATGGVFSVAAATAALAPAPVPAPDPASLALVELWPYGALLAILLYLAEIAYRRWPRPT